MSAEAPTVLPSTIRVLIADDNELFAQALSGVLSVEDRIEVVGVAGHGRQAVELAVALGPDVTLMDIAMPVMDGFEALRRIRAARPAACILMLTGSDARADINRARLSGAAGYVTKDRVSADLVDAIVEIASR